MIVGIGTDIVAVARISATLKRTENAFAEKVLGWDELHEFQRRKAQTGERGSRFVATRFAAKEALSKALGTGWREPLSWQGVQVLNDPLGKPEFHFDLMLNAWMQERGYCCHVSLSDERENAIAYVLIEQR